MHHNVHDNNHALAEELTNVQWYYCINTSKTIYKY